MSEFTRQEKLDLMNDMFVHPQSFFAQQVYDQEKGTVFYPVREGRCTHEPKHRPRDCPDVREVVFNNRYLTEHLKGKKTYAPYQLKNGTVKWVCIDVDAYNTVTDDVVRTVVMDVAIVIRKFLGPKMCLVEQSGSKGFHIWIFFEEPAPVEKAFALGHKITSQIDPVPDLHLEVYPKQTSNRLFGNTVKLPLGIHQKTGTRCLFIRSDFEPYEDQWEAIASVGRVTLQWLDDNIEAAIFDRSTRHDRKGSTKHVPVCLANIMESGVSEGLRDEAAFRIACYLRDRGVSERMAGGSLNEWNSLNDPPLDDDTLALKLDSAYREEFQWFPCKNPMFDRYCSSTCSFFDKKVELRWKNNDEDPRGKISYE